MVVSAKGRYCPHRVRDGDPHGRRLAGRGSVALGGFAALVQYSPARRTYFVRDDGVAGTRPVCAYAGQYADPYTYGGDPLNYADPTGMWSLGVGLVFGWDKSHGWNVGVGVAADVGKDKGGNFNASYAWNQDGSGSFSLGGGGTVQLAWFPIAMNFGGSYSYNSYTGHTLSTQTGACFGYEGLVCAGNEFGGSLYWDKGGNFQGATVFAENYIEAAGGSTRFSNGYEQGLFGMEGRGFYAGGNIGGLHAEVSQNGGTSWGFQESVYYGVTDKFGDVSADGKHQNVNRMIWIPTLGKYGNFNLGGNFDVTNKGIQLKQKEYLLNLVKKSGDDNFYEILKKAYGNGTDLSQADFANVCAWLETNGYKDVWRPNNPFSAYDKTTFRREWIPEYGNIEFKYTENGKVFSSYNYGNNLMDHFLIDMAGYGFSN